MLKKSMVLVMVVMITLGFGAGYGTAKVSAKSGQEPYKQTIALLMAQRDEWLSEFEDAAVKAAADKGYDLKCYDAGDNNEKQLDCVRMACESGAEVLIVNLTRNELANEIVSAAGDTKVVFVNRMPQDSSLLNENVVYVGSDERESGYYQGIALAEYFKALGKTQVRYLMVQGTGGMEHTKQRSEGALKALADQGIRTVEAAKAQECGFSRQTAQEKMTAVLQSTKDIDCIIANNDAMALGTIQAMENLDINPESIPVVGIDLLADAKEAIASGEMLMSVFQDVEGQAQTAVEAAINLERDHRFNEGIDKELDETGISPYIIWIPFEPANKENIAEFQS
ncbi:substrate-binding domain-containing protein [Ruminococcus sp. OA3]|uniref:substrate-binding domain-containing protein n=1 Tax=Ruminococcus sp. OA3 TaxID=2914164 RepID=UPI001F0671FE|nr:substrate-binding domain-containing protein [Ruminococcus sp. OA3]MCH1982016.1 substrate-binding domain-containing protein [Ruminococcus sp. OA3]